jgi:hypothetical protein
MKKGPGLLPGLHWSDFWSLDQKSIPPPSKSAVADFELIKPGGFLNGLL